MVVVPHSMVIIYFLHFLKWVEAPPPRGGEFPVGLFWSLDRRGFGQARLHGEFGIEMMIYRFGKLGNW
uniref:Uncharacterized protein n=1 Tax=Salix viminalis TaxID=40686 RepID=A0A6N2L5D2_SALVM